MAITIVEQLPNPSFSKNIVAYKVATSLSKECRARIFVETAPYSESYEFVTEIKAFPNDLGECDFYVQDLMDEDILKYNKPDIAELITIMDNVCRRIKASFFEYDSSDLELIDEVYQDTNPTNTLSIIDLQNGEDYVIIADSNAIQNPPEFKLDGISTKSATLLYELGNEVWYSLSATADYNEVVVEKGVKITIYKGTAPVLVDSGVTPILLGGRDFKSYLN